MPVRCRRATAAVLHVVGLYADTRADLEGILASPQGKATIDDVPKFATGGYSFMFDDEVVLIPYALD